MVLDSGTQSYERHRSVLSASPQRERDGKKFSEHNGLRLYPYLSPSPSPDSDPAHLGQRPKMLTKLKCSKASEARSEIRRQSETCSSFSSPCSWMRRSESTSTVNSSGRARAQIRSAASLPHIARPKSEEISRRSPCLLVALRPLNVDEEREKFFQSCYTYNPQFEYEEPVPTAVLEKYRDASDQFITQATGIIHAVLEKYGSYENFEVATGGRLLSKCQIWSIIRKYMQKEGCVGEIPPFTHPRFPLALSAPLGTPGRHAGGEASVARGGCAPESPSDVCKLSAPLSAPLFPDTEGGGSADRGPAVPSRDDGGEQPAHPGDQPVRSPAVLAGGHAAPRNRHPLHPGREQRPPAMAQRAGP